MKRILLILLALLALFSASCGNAELPPEAEYPPSTPPTEHEPTTALSASYETSWVGWTNGERLLAFAENATLLDDNSQSHLPARMLRSVEDLRAFREDFADVFQFSVKWDEFLSFDAKASQYDDAFFAENVLILLYVEATSGSYRFAVDRTIVNRDAVCVYIKQLNNPECVTDDMAGWLIAVPVSRKELPTDVQVDAVEIGYKP